MSPCDWHTPHRSAAQCRLVELPPRVRRVLLFDTANMIEKITANAASEGVSGIGCNWREADLAKAEC